MTNQEKWQRYSDNNPDVLERFVRKARAAKAAGATRISVARLREEIRAEGIGSSLPEAFSFCNTYTPWVARDIVAIEPTLAGVIVLKAIRTP